MSLAKRARVAYEPYGVIGVIGAGSAPFAQPLGQIAGALLAGNGVVFKPAARACLAGERIARVLGARGTARGARARSRTATREVGRRARAGARRQGAVHRLARGRARGGAGVRLAREGGDGRARGQGRDARARRRRPRQRRGRARCGRAAPAPARRAGRSSACTSRARSPSGSWSGSCARARALHGRRPRRPTRADGPARLRAARCAHVSELVEEALAQGAQLRCGGPMRPAAGMRGGVLRTRGAHGRARRRCG